MTPISEILSSFYSCNKHRSLSAGILNNQCNPHLSKAGTKPLECFILVNVTQKAFNVLPFITKLTKCTKKSVYSEHQNATPFLEEEICSGV